MSSENGAESVQRRLAEDKEFPSAGRMVQDGVMERADAIEQMRVACNALAGGVTGMHKLAPGLGDKAAQDEIFKALFELTKNVEVVKKQLLKLERRDESGSFEAGAREWRGERSGVFAYELHE